MNFRNYVNYISLKESEKKQGISPLKTLDHIIGMPLHPFQQKISEENLKTWKKRLNDFLSLERNRKRREELMKDISKSYWDDIQAMKYYQGKVRWIAPKNKALYVANFYGTTLSNTLGNTVSLIESSPVSLLSVFSSSSGEEHVKSFLSDELRLAVPDMQYIYVNFQESLLKAFLVRIFSAAIRKQVLKEHHVNKYFFVNKLPRDVKENMKILNMCVGYVYLVDSQCRIRWAGCGNAIEEEKKYLVKCSQRLVEEYRMKD
ncbi:unnamed protein product [Pneumocystis jirovecii]|uniref:Mitochondrial ATPase complex subunit ATP10 n=1 Tax=Pneumocystis jirovecii TaxID=42068 RepID=L0PC03_PNEJI|nr:unnamed protein product [Pneumocystis jirovecii]